MAEIIRMPRLSDTMEEGVIVGWLKKEGDSVEPGDVLAEVETDKATMELESFYEGVLLHIGVKEGPVPVDGILAVIGEKGEDYKAQLAEAEANGPASEASPETTPEPAKETATPAPAAPPGAPAAPAAPAAPVVSATPSASSDSRIKASPLAKKMAQEAGISLASVHGTGEGGRIIKRDIENYQPSAQAANNEGAKAVRGFQSGGMSESSEVTPLSQMRKTIARRLGESKYSAPHFYLTIEIDMDNAIAQRKAANAFAPVKISFNDFVVKACAMALREHPAINSSWMGDSIHTHDHIHVGVAVAVDEGLLVPVIRHADYKSLSQINVEVKDLAGKAKNKKLGLDEMQGNTFTISNLGMFGIEEFTAIINPPDACILAVGGIIQKPVVKDGEIVVGNRMKVTLSCDHRVVDGATGAAFLNTVKTLLENPINMIV